MKECNILGVKTYTDPSYIFSGGQDPPTHMMYASDKKTETAKMMYSGKSGVAMDVARPIAICKWLRVGNNQKVNNKPRAVDTIHRISCSTITHTYKVCQIQQQQWPL